MVVCVHVIKLENLSSNGTVHNGGMLSKEEKVN